MVGRVSNEFTNGSYFYISALEFIFNNFNMAHY